jgi:hypothetical protein
LNSAEGNALNARESMNGLILVSHRPGKIHLHLSKNILARI